MGEIVRAPVPGRACGTCTLCCKVLAITELNKPAGVWCTHCKPGAGCGIYADRPPSCGFFDCAYLVRADVGEEWKPNVSRMVLMEEPQFNRVLAHVDPQRPDAWRAAPYHAQLRLWASRAAATGGQVHVRVGPRTVVILPDRDVDLGVVGDDERILMRRTVTPLGVREDVEKVKRDDPRLRAAG